MRWIRTSSVRRTDQMSGFQNPVPNNGVPSLHFLSDGIFEMPNWDVTSWLVASCHLSAQCGCLNGSSEDYNLLRVMLVYHPEESVCLLYMPRTWVIRQMVDTVGRDRLWDRNQNMLIPPRLNGCSGS